MLESYVIKKHIELGDIIYYGRFVDDTLLVTKKGSKNNIFRIQYPGLKVNTFTLEKSVYL